MSTPMKIQRTMNEKYAIIRAEEEEQRKRKTCVKREVTPSVCRNIMVAQHILPIILPKEDVTTMTSVTTPHARPFESQPNSP